MDLLDLSPTFRSHGNNLYASYALWSGSLSEFVNPEMVEHDDVTDLIVPVDDDRASLVGPTGPERDVKRQSSGNSRLARRHVENSNDIVLAVFAKRRADRSSIRAENGQ